MTDTEGLKKKLMGSWVMPDLKQWEWGKKKKVLKDSKFQILEVESTRIFTKSVKNDFPILRDGNCAQMAKNLILESLLFPNYSNVFKQKIYVGYVSVRW